jgi:O-antigen/teichoic acid export membrane protein
VPLAVLMEDFLRLWISDDFATQSGFVATIVAASCLVRGAFLPYEALFRGLGKPQYYLVVVALASGTVLLTDLILIPRFGLAGAGYAYCLAPIWGFASICFVWFRILKMRNLPQLMTLVFGRMLIGLAVLAGCYWLHSLVDPVPTWIGLVLWGTALFTGTALVLIAYEQLVSPENGVIQYLRARAVNMRLGELWAQP